MKPNPYQSPSHAETAGTKSSSRSRSRWTMVLIAGVLVLLNPYPVFDLIVGGFAGSVVSGRLNIPLSIACGILGAVAALVLNVILAVAVTGGFVVSGVVELSALLAAIVLYGGAGVLIGMAFNYAADRNAQRPM